MKAQLLIENLEKNISIISKVIPTATHIPILSNVLIEAEKEGLFVSATDLEVGARIKIPAKIIKEGRVTVPGKQLLEVIGSLPKDKIEIERTKDTLRVESRGNIISFQTIPAEEFPVLYKEKGENIGELSQKETKKLFEPLLFSVSGENTRPQLTGIYIGEDGGKTTIVSTDGYRLSLKTSSNKALRVGTGVIISTRIIHELLALKGEALRFDAYVSDKSNQILFESKEATLVGRLIEGTFPNYQKVIPGEGKTAITVDREEFLQNARLSTVFARDANSVVFLEVIGDRLRLIARSGGVGKSELEMDCEKKGEDGAISFNPRFLTDVLKNIESKTVTMKINSPKEPALFAGEEKDFLHVIMPVQTPGDN